MPIPDSINADHIRQAIDAWNNGERGDFGPSRKFDLVIDGKLYPPKAIVGIAARLATGEALRPSDFSGGERSSQANGFLRGLGFDVPGRLIEPDKEGAWGHAIDRMAAARSSNVYMQQLYLEPER